MSDAVRKPSHTPEIEILDASQAPITSDTIRRAQEALGMVSEGIGLVRACKASGISMGTLHRAIQSSKTLLLNYHLSQLSRAEIVADEVISIADDEDRDPIQARNAIDARKWYASKINPRKYGDRIEVEVNEKIDLSTAIAEARSRVRGIPKK